MNFLILTHGAGSNRNAPLLVALANAFLESGTTVVRYDLPFRQERPHGPPRPADAERDREGLRAEVLKIRKADAGSIHPGSIQPGSIQPGSIHPGSIWIGGHSYGGRQASMLAAEMPGLVEGLLLLSYPLHPPRKPAQLRTAHFPKLETPAIFVHGSRDPFGTLQEFQQAIALIPAQTRLIDVPGAGHELGRDHAGLALRIVSEARFPDAAGPAR